MGGFNFKSERKDAANRGSRAAIIAGLPATEQEASRQAGVQDFRRRTEGVREQTQAQNQGNAQAGIANLLQLVALMQRSKQDEAQKAQLNSLAQPVPRPQQQAQPRPPAEYDVPYAPNDPRPMSGAAPLQPGGQMSPELYEFLLNGAL